MACVGLLAAHLFNLNLIFLSNDICVPDHGSRDRDVVLVRRTVGSRKPRGVRNLEWGGNGDGMGRGRSVREQPGAKVDRIASRQRRASK